MPLQNRVTPTGEFIADPARGLLMGNRGGALHLRGKILGTRRWISRRWICCRLAFKDRRREIMAPGRYTELFFLDEATALAAGHRPCFECRRQDAEQFVRLWSMSHGLASPAGADTIDSALHAERVDAASQRRHLVKLDDMPTGCMVLEAGMPIPWLVLDRRLLRWSPAGYCEAKPRPRNVTAEALTPPSIISVLNSGYQPLMHESARISG